MRLLHAADLHVDSPLRGLSAYVGAPVEAIRSATRRALTNMVTLAQEEEVDAVLLAGDIFDGDWPDYNTGLFFRSQMSVLLSAGIEVYLVSGNHDAASQISRKLELPGVVELSKAAPDSRPSPGGLDLVVHGQGFMTRDVTENLAAAYPARVPGVFNVGLLHTALTGDANHARYAPCSVDDLQSKGYDYWALGHVHNRRVVAEDPYIVFPGNIQGRHARETGPKGCVLVDVADDATVTTRFAPLDVVRWAHLEVDVSAAADESAAVALAREALALAHDEADGRLLAARVSFVGASDAHDRLWRELEGVTAEVRAAANDLDQAWVEKVRPATTPAFRDDGSDVAGSVDDLRDTARRVRADPDVLRRLVEDSPLVAKLPPEARSGDSGIRPDLDTWRQELFDEAVDLLVAMVEGGPAVRIDRLDLTFGRFEGYSLDLAGDGVHLVLGQNEAGKSTIRHAVAEFLFGIHPQTTYDFAFSAKSALQIGARLRCTDGTTVEAVRHKRNNNPLVDDAGQPFDLAPHLGGLDRDTFLRQFAVDHEELLRGGQSLFEAKGDVARSLFETQSGARLNDVLKQLGEEMDKLYKQRASNPTLNAAIARHAEAKARFRAATLRVDQYDQQKSRLDHAEKERKRLEQEVARLTGERSRLERVRQAMPNLAKLSHLVAERDGLAAAGPTVRRETGEAFDALLKRIEEADAAEAHARRRLDRVAATRAASALDRAVLDQAPEIDWLHGERKAVQEAQTRAADLRRTAADLAAAAATLAAADEAAPELVRRIEESRTALTKLDTETEAARKQAAKRAKARDKAARRLDGLVGAAEGAAADQPDAAASARVLRPLLRAADRTIADTLAARRGEVTRLAEELDRLRRRHALADDAHEHPVPTAGQVTAHRETLAEALSARADNAERLADLRKEIDRGQRELEVLLQSGAPPTEAELDAARERRGHVWREVRTRLLEPPVPAESPDVLTLLTDEHEDAVADADGLADRLRREAEKTNARLRLQIDIAADEEQVRQLTVERDQLENRRSELDETWAELWRPSGLPLPERAAALDLLTALDRARELADGLASAQSDLDAAQEKAAVTEAGLRTALPHSPADLGLAALLTYADEELRAREKAVDALAAADEELRDAEQTVEDCEDRRTEWTAEWTALLHAHELQGDPETVLARLADRTEAARQRRTAGTAEAEAAALEARVAAFAERLAAVATIDAVTTTDTVKTVETVDPLDTASSQDLYLAVERLHQELKTQRAILLKQEELDAQLGELGLEIEDAADRRTTADQAVEALIAESGLVDRAEMRSAIDRGTEIAGYEERIRFLEDSLAGHGVPLGTLRAEVAEFEGDPDRVAAELDIAGSDLDSLQREYEDAISAHAEQRKILRDLDESAGAAEASEKASEELAAVVGQSEEYLRLHLARRVLETCMEEYRATNQDPVLARAEGYFRTLTSERFDRLVTDSDAKGRFLLRGRRAGGEPVDVEAMSEGTRDQLYLALRLAALDRHSDAGRPMPVLLDDVLMTFDDDRAAAALRVADTIADRFQVIVFTHHPHMAELAAAALPPGRVHVHRLPGGGPTVTSPTVPAQSGVLSKNDPRDPLPAD